MPYSGGTSLLIHLGPFKVDQQTVSMKAMNAFIVLLHLLHCIVELLFSFVTSLKQISAQR